MIECNLRRNFVRRLGENPAPDALATVGTDHKAASA